MRQSAKRIASFIQAHLHLRVFLPLLTVALATTWFGLFYSVEKFSHMTGGLAFMDMQPTLTPTKIFAQIPTYTPDTVAYYIVWSLFDYLWPFVTFTTMLFICAWLLKFLSDKWQQRFWLLVASAYITVIFDWLENLGFIALVLGLPAEPLWMAQVTLALHAGKLTFNMIFNVGTWVLLGAVIVKRVRTKSSVLGQ